VQGAGCRVGRDLLGAMAVDECRVVISGGLDLLGARLVVDLRAEHRLAALAVRCCVDLVEGRRRFSYEVSVGRIEFSAEVLAGRSGLRV